MCFILMSSLKESRPPLFKTFLIQTITGDNSGPQLIHLQWIRILLLPLQQRRITFNKQWSFWIYLQMLKPKSDPSHTQKLTGIHMQGNAPYTERIAVIQLISIHMRRCAVYRALAGFISPPPLWNVFSYLSMTCCLEWAAVTRSTAPPVRSML